MDGESRIYPPLGVERFEQRQPDHLLHLEVALGLRAGGDQAPAVAAVLLVVDVEAGAFFRVAQDRVGLLDLPEPAVVAGLLVVGMEPLRQQAKHALYRFLLGVAVDLKDLVIINRSVVGHSLLLPGVTRALADASLIAEDDDNGEDDAGPESRRDAARRERASSGQ